jgi:hypothetical protein
MVVQLRNEFFVEVWMTFTGVDEVPLDVILVRWKDIAGRRGIVLAADTSTNISDYETQRRCLDCRPFVWLQTKSIRNRKLVRVEIIPSFKLVLLSLDMHIRLHTDEFSGQSFLGAVIAAIHGERYVIRMASRASDVFYRCITTRQMYTGSPGRYLLFRNTFFRDIF